MTKQLTVSEVEHVADLARLKLGREDVKKFVTQLSDILSYINQLDELDTENVVPTSQVTGLINVARNDETTASLAAEEVLKNAPEKSGNLFKVKAVFENNS